MNLRMFTKAISPAEWLRYEKKNFFQILTVTNCMYNSIIITLSQFEQKKGFSPVCVRKWAINWHRLKNSCLTYMFNY